MKSLKFIVSAPNSQNMVVSHCFGQNLLWEKKSKEIPWDEKDPLDKYFAFE